MASLIRCRGALSEIAQIFGVPRRASIDWRPLIWPGQDVLTVVIVDGERQLRPMTWGLPASQFARSRSASQRATLLPRDLADRSSGLLLPEALRQCLIVIEDVAYPDGEAGKRTRTWAGLWEAPLHGWAGMCALDSHRGSCAGLLMASNQLVARVSPLMPFLVEPGAYGDWLDGCSALSLAARCDEANWYVEPSDEPWTNVRAGLSP